LPAVQTAAAAEVFARQGSLWIRSRQSDQLQVFTLSGQTVVNTRIPAGTSRIDNLPAGLYVVRIGGSAAKVVLR
ncbi:MAG: T9SS type A sorting domain-containing protein, partial [Bacteroidales bacterium]|nr:T9SS type A sorting domain-containing protein [Bacteroidales bacterium]